MGGGDTETLAIHHVRERSPRVHATAGTFLLTFSLSRSYSYLYTLALVRAYFYL